jgi:hypothetical protein
VAELVDALDSGSSGRKLVEVRVLSGALMEQLERPGAPRRAFSFLLTKHQRLGIEAADGAETDGDERY